MDETVVSSAQAIQKVTGYHALGIRCLGALKIIYSSRFMLLSQSQATKTNPSGVTSCGKRTQALKAFFGFVIAAKLPKSLRPQFQRVDLIRVSFQHCIRWREHCPEIFFEQAIRCYADAGPLARRWAFAWE